MTFESWAGDTPTTNLEGVLKFPDMTSFNQTASITLNHGEYITYSRDDGSFVIYNVEPGTHQIDIHSSVFHFGQVKVQLLEGFMDTPKCLEYSYIGATKHSIPYPLELTAYASHEYFEQRKGFSIFAIFKNPMFMMMLFSVCMMLLMPKMMEGLEPAEKERMKQQMEMQKDPSKMFSQIWGDITGDQDVTSRVGKKN